MIAGDNTIRIMSEGYGELIIAPDQVYHFPQTIVGFPNLSDYALLPYDGSELYVLHSIIDNTSFILIPSMHVGKNYAFEMNAETAELLNLQSEEDMFVFFIVNIAEGIPYINAKAPILIVPSSRKGCQYIINDPAVSVREPLLGEDG